jgi:hypothetical protein
MRGVAGIALAAGASVSLLAQEGGGTAKSRETAVVVPFAGCESVGPAGRLEAPQGESRSVPIRPEAAGKLAYYKSAQELGVLAPRGWHCLGTSDAGGQRLLVSPRPIEPASLFTAGDTGFTGPLIEVSLIHSDTAGRFEIARIIARVFPAYKEIVARLCKKYDEPASAYTFGPYPEDTLNYKSNRVVEYTTPPQTDGLGTESRLSKGGRPISGVAMLVGKAPDLLLLSVRLPGDLNGLTPAIVHQAERDAPR